MVGRFAYNLIRFYLIEIKEESLVSDYKSPHMAQVGRLRHVGEILSAI
jgi:hypothetical protein